MGNNIRLITYSRSFLIGDMYDYTDENTYSFEFGKSYALIGDFGKGGNSISGLLTNKYKIMNESIEINNAKDNLYPQKAGWCIGQSSFSKITGHEISLNRLLKESENSPLFSELVDFFRINPREMPHYISEMAHEKWRVSIAIGLLKNKKVFGFSFMNSRFLYDVLYSSGNALSIKKITEYGGIVIIPTNDKELITPIVDNVITLNNSRFESLFSYVKDQMERMDIK